MTQDRDHRSSVYKRRHLIFGWWSLSVFLTLGIVLELLHGYKVPWYLKVDYEMRRLMLTLAHTHGTLLSLVNIVFGLTVASMEGTAARLRSVASFLLMGASVLLPVGFLLGGLYIYDGDPGLGAVILVPMGALLLLAAVLLIAWEVTKTEE